MADNYSLVKAWVDDVCRSQRDRDNAAAALRSERRVLEELDRMPPSYQGRLGQTRAHLVATIELLEENEAVHAAKLPEFVALMGELPNSLVARALVLRAVEGLTWQRCAMRLHVNRQHLERLYRKSMPDLMKLVPSRYR